MDSLAEAQKRGGTGFSRAVLAFSPCPQAGESCPPPAATSSAPPACPAASRPLAAAPPAGPGNGDVSRVSKLAVMTTFFNANLPFGHVNLI